jgi:putative ATP-binding cassette transporter
VKIISFLIRCSTTIQHSKSILLVILLTGVVSGVCNAALIALINATLNRQGASARTLGLSFVAICIILPVARLASQALIIVLTAASLFELRMRMSRNILSTPLRKLEKIGAHRLLAALTDDASTITTAFINLPLLCMHVAIVVATLVYMAWLSWGLLLGVFGFIVVAVLGYYLMMTRGLGYFKSAREAWDGLFKHFQTLTLGTKELKLHSRRREAFLSDGLRAAAMSVRRLNTSGHIFNAAAGVWGQTIAFVLIGLLLFVAPDIRAIETPVLTGYVLAMLYMLTPLEYILITLPTLNRAAIAVQKMEDLGFSLMTPADAPAWSTNETTHAFSHLELAGVTHTYRREGGEDNFLLGPVDLSFRPGELVFVAGGNGTGKTTLAKILVGLYTPESGEIRLNHAPITDDTREGYRQLFSAIFSDFYLFESLFGFNASGLDEKARAYLAQLQLESKVQVEAGTLSTVDLSQGQRKRLALLTAYLEDRPIYLFDEWAADQDPLFKEIFYLQLLPELKSQGKLVIVITHDDRYYQVADRLIKLDYGKVVNDQYLAQPAEMKTAVLA